MIPTIESTLAGLPNGLLVLRGSDVNGFRGKIYRLAGKPGGQCFGSTMVVHDDLWLPGREWDFLRTVRHELVHHRQSRGWRLPLFLFAYVFSPLWIGLTPRAFLELPAYRETLRGFVLQWTEQCFDADIKQRLLHEKALSIAKTMRAWKLYFAMGWLLPERFWLWLLLRGIV